MTSPLLALFTRSVRADARSGSTYWARTVMGAFLLFVVLIFAATDTLSGGLGAPGLAFFITVVTLQMIAVTSVGLSYFISAVAEEKEEQTLGLLRMTGLNTLSILLGKSTSRLCGVVLLLLGQFPFTIFAITLGGVSLRQIFAVNCTLVAFTFLLCNLALLGSVLAKRTVSAIAFCVVILGLWLGSGPLLGALSGFYGTRLGIGAWTDRMATALWEATPLARLTEVLRTGFAGPPLGWQVASNLLFGGACFLLAWAAFERFSDRAADQAAARGRPTMTGAAGTRRPGPRWLVPSRVWKDALLWKDFYFLCGGYVGFALRSLGYGGALLWFLQPAAGTLISPPSGLAFWTSFVFTIDFAALAARTLRTEINDQTLAGLAALPASMREVVNRKSLACLLAVIPGIVATSIMQFLTDPSPSGIVVSTGSQSYSPVTPAVVSTITDWATTFFLVHVVAWLSLSMKRGALPMGYLLTHVLRWMVLATSTLCALALMGLVPYHLYQLNMRNLAVDLWGPLVTAVLCVAVAWFLHSVIRIQLEFRAGEN